MLILDITTDVGPAATPSALENLIRSLRVATDVAHACEVRRIRRSLTEQMKFPTDGELENLVGDSPRSEDDGPGYRARQHLSAREHLRDEVRDGSFGWRFDEMLYRRGLKGTNGSMIRAAGLDRGLEAQLTSPASNPIGLDVIDPVLYQALVSDALSRDFPEPVRVSELRYSNPLFTRFWGKGRAEKTVSMTAEVIETIALLGPNRQMARADAEVATRTIGHRVEESELKNELLGIEVERKREALRRERIANDASERLFSDETQRLLVDQMIRTGRIDAADVIAELGAGEALALGALGARRFELVQRYHEDSAEGDDLKGPDAGD